MMFDNADDGLFVRLLKLWLCLCGMALPFYLGYTILTAITR